MGMKRFTGILLAGAIGIAFLSAGPARAGSMLVGTNLGFAHYAPEDGDGLTVFSVPEQGSFFGTFQPGFRIGGFADAARRHETYIDTGFSLFSANGFSITSIQARLGYEYMLSASATTPFVGFGIGFMHLGYDGDDATTTLFGGVLGVRHTLAHGHGAVRGAVRIEHQLESGSSGGFPALNVVGLEAGLDLYVN